SQFLISTYLNSSLLDFLYLVYLAKETSSGSELILITLSFKSRISSNVFKSNSTTHLPFLCLSFFISYNSTNCTYLLDIKHITTVPNSATSSKPSLTTSITLISSNNLFTTSSCSLISSPSGILQLRPYFNVGSDLIILIASRKTPCLLVKYIDVLLI